jgi:NitT/TauT family transport system ATP-binding protein
MAGRAAGSVRQALRWVGLTDVGGKYPWRLSGGMQQGMSIARALASRPAPLPMDEPFAPVDARARFELGIGHAPVHW